MTDAVEDSRGMAYLARLPRRVVTVYLPLAIFVFVLLFPFYWMAVTTFKPNEELYSYKDHNPLWIGSPREAIQWSWVYLSTAAPILPLSRSRARSD